MRDRQSNPRIQAVVILQSVLFSGRSLTDALEQHQESSQPQFTREICFGVCRWYYQLNFLVEQLVKKPFKEKDSDVLCVILIGLYQLIHLNTPDYAACSESVNLVSALKKVWAKSVVNAVLRNFIRQRESLFALMPEDAQWSHPQWLIEKIKNDWPNDWQQILTANNQRPVMTLRVDTRVQSRDAYLAQLQQNEIVAVAHEKVATAVTLGSSCDVTSLPGFAQGIVSVQDAAAQLAAPLLDLHTDQRVLDACAAPGGKTLHIAQQQTDLKNLIAIDISEARAEKIKQNMSRTNASVQIKVADAADSAQWWDQQPFDRILLDAPCSAVGVIRRHPDIKLLRQSSDIAQLTTKQTEMLTALWPLLVNGGKLLYVTCSILRDECEAIISQFLATHDDAREIKISADYGVSSDYGIKIRTGDFNMDGFFYALLHKQVL